MRPISPDWVSAAVVVLPCMVGETPKRETIQCRACPINSRPTVMAPRPARSQSHGYSLLAASRATDADPDGMRHVIRSVVMMHRGSSVQSANAPRSATRRASSGSLTVQTMTRSRASRSFAAFSAVNAPV
jgi:hypothetical protein